MDVDERTKRTTTHNNNRSEFIAFVFISCYLLGHVVSFSVYAFRLLLTCFLMSLCVHTRKLKAGRIEGNCKTCQNEQTAPLAHSLSLSLENGGGGGHDFDQAKCSLLLYHYISWCVTSDPSKEGSNKKKTP